MAITRVKICGLTRKQDVEAAIEFGADALGFVMESTSPRYVDGDKARGLMKDLPPFVYRVGVFATMYPSTDVSLCDAVQSIKWSMPKEVYARKLQVIRVRADLDLNHLVKFAKDYDAFVLDAFHERMHGGTGKVVDWGLAADIVQVFPRPIVLAGGLNPDNVGDAIRKVRPYAVDVSSGVEFSPGLKDLAKMKDFIQAAKQS